MFNIVKLFQNNIGESSGVGERGAEGP